MEKSEINTDEFCPEYAGLRRNMKPRHLLMISIGGTIGTGLFLGIGHTIHTAGPLGTVLAYMAGGLVMYLVLLCLGELATAMPVAGSFQTYATRFISPAAGFATGWLYWMSWALCIAADFTAAGIIMNNFYPEVPIYIWCGIFAGFLSSLNLLSVRAYGESEFWFASIKVFAIIAFIIAGAGLIFGFTSNGQALGTSNFITTKGLFPNGISAVLLTMVFVVYSFQGTELVGIAAGECENPGENIPKVMKAVVVRIIVFFWLAVIVLAATIPFTEAGVLESPFAHVFGITGIPYAKMIMTVVVLTAALSAGNSGLYASSRLLWSMSQEGNAPAWCGKLNSRGVPYNAILITVIVACASLITKAVAADTVYLFLISSTGLTGCLIWMVIAVCQINFRREYLSRGGAIEQLKFRTPLFPAVPIMAFIANLVAILALYLAAEYRNMLYCSIPVVLITYLVGVYHNRDKRKKGNIDKKNYSQQVGIK
ncbi:MAG: amino acid permease [Syntrophomonadaceae bacterium]|nr:amino acid permease [Syntrophomonadaceae bacterium]MDD4549020.1 amino acid permease [Syntrophomonadaceae bacterium]